MPKKFSGTDHYRLPAQSIEPYRLWFEFLKLGCRDKRLEVDRSLYEPWGPYEALRFNDWWKDHWESLFAVDIGVREIDSGEAMKIEPRGHAILVRIPLYMDPKRSLAAVASLLKAHEASERLIDMPNGHFYLKGGTKPDGTAILPATRFLKNLDKVRFYLNLYRFWVTHDDLDDQQRIEKTVLSYKRWGDGWNARSNANPKKRKPIHVPETFTKYANYLMQRANGKRLKLHDGHEDHADARRQVTRDLGKAQKIARNVASGVFPGEYA